MARHSHKSEVRRQGARRVRAEQHQPWWRRLRAQMSPSVFLIGAGFYLTTLVIQFWGDESMQWRSNQRVDRDITARADFRYEDRVETEKRRQMARASAPNVYVSNQVPVELLRGKLRKLRELAAAAGGDTAKLIQQAKQEGWDLSPKAAATLLEYATEGSRAEFQKLIADLTQRLSSRYIVERPTDPNRRSIPPTARLQGSDQAPEVDETELIYATDETGKVNRGAVEKAISDMLTTAELCPEPLREPIGDLVVNAVIGPPASGRAKPNPLWLYSPGKTAEEMQAAENRVEPYTIERKEGDTLVTAGTVLGQAELNLLRNEHEAFLEKQARTKELRQAKLLRQTGDAVLILLVVLGLGLYTFKYQNRILQNPARAFALAGLMLLVVLLSRLNERLVYPYDLPLELAVLFVVIAAALLAIAYNQRFALGAGVGLVALVTLASRGDLGLFLTLLVATGVTVFALNDVRTRSKLVAVGCMAALGAGVASLATGLAAGQELKYVLIHASVAVGAGVFAGFTVQGVLHYFEKIFGVATSMTLLEWCDAGQPLLRRLAQEAPGTYSHSLILSQMAEEAAEAIGANGLLARVGALYHDIGKMQKSPYFVENQEARINRHDRLAPTMSLLIIVGHVKDGMELARAYSLPRVLHQFIAEHHGTTVVRYFHHVASEAAAKNTKTKGKHDREVPESEFRYPGPKPRSKESAILMICDSCEGAVRALAEPTPGRVESTIHAVVMDRLNDGQFDACDITLRELNVVEQALVKSLCAIHHGRIKYPKGSAAQKAQERAEEAEKAPAASEGHFPAEPAPAATEVAHQA